MGIYGDSIFLEGFFNKNKNKQNLKNTLVKDIINLVKNAGDSLADDAKLNNKSFNEFCSDKTDKFEIDILFTGIDISKLSLIKKEFAELMSKLDFSKIEQKKYEGFNKISIKPNKSHCSIEVNIK